MDAKQLIEKYRDPIQTLLAEYGIRKSVDEKILKNAIIVFKEPFMVKLVEAISKFDRHDAQEFDNYDMDDFDSFLFFRKKTEEEKAAKKQKRAEKQAAKKSKVEEGGGERH